MPTITRDQRNKDYYEVIRENHKEMDEIQVRFNELFYGMPDSSLRNRDWVMQLAVQFIVMKKEMGQMKYELERMRKIVEDFFL